MHYPSNREYHGLSKSPEYKLWRACKDRVKHQDKSKAYGRYRLKMYKPWYDRFQVFLAAVGVRPTKHHSLDRINNKKGYYPGNVRWATRHQQQRNTNQNVYHTIDGLQILQVDACEQFNMTHLNIKNAVLRYGSLQAFIDAKRRGYFYDRNGMRKNFPNKRK